MRLPRPFCGPPKYSATNAEMTAVGAAIVIAVNRYGHGVRDARLAQHLRRRGGVRAQQLEVGGLDLAQALGDVDEHDEVHDERHHQPPRDLRRDGEHVVEHRHEHDDRDRVEGDGQRGEHVVEQAEPHQQEAHRRRRAPCRRRGRRARCARTRRRPPRRARSCRRTPSRSPTAWAGSTASSRRRRRPAPTATRKATPNTTGGHAARHARRTARRSLDHRSSIPAAAVVDLVAAQRLADLGDLLEERGVLAGVGVAVAAEVDVDDVGDPSRAGATSRRRGRTGTRPRGSSGSRTRRSSPVSAQIRSSSACMCSRVISSRAPNGSSISSSGGWAASARAMATRCCMPPDSCHGRCSAKSPSLTSCSISIARWRRLRLVPALQLERQLDVLDDAAPVEQAGLLEGHAVLLVEAGLVGRLAVDA